MLTVAFVTEKLNELMGILNAKHIALDGLAQHLFGEYKRLNEKVFSDACTILSKQEFMRFPQFCHFKDAISIAYTKYQGPIDKAKRERQVSDDDRPTREDWNKFYGRLSGLDHAFAQRKRSMDPTEPLSDKEEMKLLVKEAKKRREDPDFKYKKHFSQEEGYKPYE